MPPPKWHGLDWPVSDSQLALGRSQMTRSVFSKDKPGESERQIVVDKLRTRTAG